MSDNILTYFIARELLQGSVGKYSFSMQAWSGGRRGSKTVGAAEHSFASYNVFRKEQQSKGISGGPLPPGLYFCRYVAHHPPFGECIFLEQTVTALFQIDEKANVRFYNRGGFYIHGRGPIGSQGCIVVENEAERKRLNSAIKGSAGTVMLKVADAGMPMPAAIETTTHIA